MEYRLTPTTRPLLRIVPCLTAAVLVVTINVTPTAQAQTADYYFRDPAGAPYPGPAGLDGDWFVETDGDPGTSGGTNWYDLVNLTNFIPDHSFADGENAFIENGGTAFVQITGTIDPGSITIGAANGTSGGLEIRNNGVLNVMQGNSTTGNIVVGSATGMGTVDVLPGGTLTTVAAISQGSNAGNSIRVGGATGATATLTAASASFGSNVQVYPNAALSTTTGGVSFGGSSNYQVEVTAGGNAAISAGTSASLGGNLHLNFSGVSPAVGNSWQVLEANSYSNSFGSVSTNASLAFNEAFVFTQSDLGGGRVGLNAGVEEVLVLQVNRDTGEVTMTHPGSSTVTLDGYFIASAGGLLSDNPAYWDSLSEGGQLGGDWIETDQRPDNIAELKIGSDATFGSNISLGHIYNPLGGTFGDSEKIDDLEFNFRRSSDSAQIPGVVQYTGTRFNNLVLQVDPTGTGDAYLRNTSATVAQIDAYEILSVSSLSESGWDSLAEQGITDNVWLEADTNGPGQLAEFDSQGFTSIAPGMAINLGPLFTGGTQDLEFNFLMMGTDEGTEGEVVYEAFVPDALPGDYNEDNIVNHTDYTVFRDHVGDPAGLPNDNGLGAVSAAHFGLWKSQYGQTLPAAIASARAVPEPATTMLVGTLLGLAFLRRSTRAS